MKDDEELASLERSLIEKSAEPCLVCGVPTSILHLQVNACRACAAFFRRSIRVHKTYRCQKNKGSCNVTVKTLGKPLCRYCRYHKCLQVGMRLNKLQEDDPAYDANFTKITVEREPTHIDFERLFQETNIILERSTSVIQESAPKYVKSFCRLLSGFLETTKPLETVKLRTNKEIDEKIRMGFLEAYFIKVAQLLAQFQSFAALPLKDKQLLFKRFWQIFMSLERAFQSYQYFGNNLGEEKNLLDTHHYIDLANLQNITEDTIGRSVFLFPFIDNVRAILKPFKRLSITLFELAYMLQISLWSCYDIDEISLPTRVLAEEILIKVSAEMHDYFSQDLRMPYYATRQAQLFRVVHYAEFILRLKNQLLTAKEIFNFGKYAFPYCAFEQSYYNYINKR